MYATTLFATGFVLERDPLSWADLPGAVRQWVQSAGAVAAIGLLIWSIAWFAQKRRPGQAWLGPTTLPIPLAFLLYLALSLLYLGHGVLGLSFLGRWLPVTEPGQPPTPGDWLHFAAGACALLAVILPIVQAFLTRIRWQRIWALARLSVKEAVRSRVVLIFAAMALVFLFADWFVSYKDENQVRNYVRVVYWSMAPLFLMTAGLLGAFSIPNDVKDQSIHTIVTKPVEKFEIVLGRFLGYATVLTIGLAVVSGLSLIYVWRGVNPDAEKESFRARAPHYGKLDFYPTPGTNVGRVWTYRKYIAAPPAPGKAERPKHYAFWSFHEVPGHLAERDQPADFEFTFDIFRMIKGDENRGVFCTFTFVDGRIPINRVEPLLETARRERERLRAQGIAKAQIEKDLLQKFGVFERAGFEVIDYHTQAIQVPAELFKKLNLLEKEKPRLPDAGKVVPPMLNVLVNVERRSHSQMLGVATRDFYLLGAERRFEINFFKGIIGMWFTFMLVLGVAVACSTYLSGVISWLVTMFLFGAGLFKDFVQRLAENKEEGPFAAAVRILHSSAVADPLDDSPTGNLLKGSDEFYRWLLQRFLNLIPNVNRYDLHQYVANGFDIPWGQVLLVDNFIPLAGYLIPCAVLAFYLMNFREIANPT